MISVLKFADCFFHEKERRKYTMNRICKRYLKISNISVKVYLFLHVHKYLMIIITACIQISFLLNVNLSHERSNLLVCQFFIRLRTLLNITGNITLYS